MTGRSRYKVEQAKDTDSADFATAASTARWTGISGLAV
jgi:hypothetical protein